MDFEKLLQLMIAKNGSDLFITADVARFFRLVKHRSMASKPWS